MLIFPLRIGTQEKPPGPIRRGTHDAWDACAGNKALTISYRLSWHAFKLLNSCVCVCNLLWLFLFLLAQPRWDGGGLAAANMFKYPENRTKKSPPLLIRQKKRCSSSLEAFLKALSRRIMNIFLIQNIPYSTMHTCTTVCGDESVIRLVLPCDVVGWLEIFSRHDKGRGPPSAVDYLDPPRIY